MNRLNKIWLFIFIIALVIVLPYIIVPAVYNTTISKVANTRLTTANRILTEENYTYLLWSALAAKDGEEEYILDDVHFLPVNNTGNNSVIKIHLKNHILTSFITASSLGEMASIYIWNYTLSTGRYPWEKIDAWFVNRKISRTLMNILNNLKDNSEDLKKVYKTDINVTNLTDSTLITIKGISKEQPTTNQIYSEILKLRKYAALNNAKATNYPMLNIRMEGDSFLFMVALPVNKDLKKMDNIEPKRMLAGGKFLATSALKGGEKTINIMEKQLENFKSDFGFSSPAIPFQSLITERNAEADTNRWETILYYPVF